MYFENYYINFSSNSIISSISTYRNIMIKFINKFIRIKFTEYLVLNELYLDALIYSKYYVYYKTMNCVYSENIMNIIMDIDFEQNNINQNMK